MARVTIEDSLEQVPERNRFKLVVLAAELAAQRAMGRPSFLPDSKDKPPVVALREIAAGLVNVSELEEEIIRKISKGTFLHKRHGDSSFNEAMSEILSQLLSNEAAEIEEIAEEEEQGNSDGLIADEWGIDEDEMLLLDDLPPEDDDFKSDFEEDTVIIEQGKKGSKKSMEAIFDLPDMHKGPIYSDVDVED